MKLWNQVATPPPNALKKITGGRLKGMSDIKPQWRYQVLTEFFGPCGQGWGYEIKRLWLEPGTDGQMFAFADILLWAGESKNIPGSGGSMLLIKEKSGLYHNDEAFKMAITDALSVACKMLGVGADVYHGTYDGSKFEQKVAQKQINQIQDYQKKIAILKDPAEFDSLLAGLVHVTDQAAVKVIKLSIKNQGEKVGVVYDIGTKKFISAVEKSNLSFLLNELGKIETKELLIKFEKAFDPQISGLNAKEKIVYDSASADQMAIIMDKK